MRRLALGLLLLALACLTTSAVQAGRLTCGVCEALVDEMNVRIESTTLKHSVQTRFRVDEKKRTPYARTEHHLLELLEGDAMPKEFDKFGVVRPHTKTAKHMKRAYELHAKGETIEPLERKKKPAAAAAAATTETPAEPAATTTEAAPATDAPSDNTADAKADALATPAADAAAATTPAAESQSEPEPEPYAPFRPLTTELPLSLLHNHLHLVEKSLAATTGLVIDSSAELRREIRSALTEFLDEYQDEAMLMFHRDVPNLKHKLCYEVSEACVPQKRKPKHPKKAAAAPKDEL